MQTRFLITFYLTILSTLSYSQTIPVSEKKYVNIGGIEQWITIEGSDVKNPVILFIHGGPGSVLSPYSDQIYGSWKDEFTVVQWDQRGAGRTFGKNVTGNVEEYMFSNPLTIEQMVNDGIELAEYLIQHLGKEKIILLGSSWGSVLGLKMALKHPDLFYAYVGHSQIVNPTQNMQYGYDEVIKHAENANDQEAIEKLKLLGPPPYGSAKDVGQLNRIIKKYENAGVTPAPASWWNVAPEYDNETDSKNRYNGDDYSFVHYAGFEKLGIKAMSADINFMKDGLNVQIPVFLIQGEKDITTPKNFSRAYFEKLNAPEKEYFLVADAAHGFNQAVIDMQYEVLTEQVVSIIDN